MNDLWHGTIRHTLTTVSVAAVLLGGFFIFMHRAFPPSGPVHGPVSVVTPSPVERETQAVIDALALSAARSSGVSPLLQPAVTVLEKTGAVSGLSGAQVAQILGALKAKTVEKIAVGSKLVGPSPAPTPTNIVYKNIFDAAYAADTHALSDTTIKTDVTISREEVAPSRVGSLISAYGSGLSFAVIRRKQFELELAAIMRAAHIAPAACPMYLIPHTQLSLGPCLYYDHKVSAGFGAKISF